MLALAFVGAQAAEVYGAHPCPRHHHDTGVEAVVGGGSSDHVTPAGDRTDPDTGPGVCTCIGSCHGGATAPVPSEGVAGAFVPAPDPEAAARVVERPSADERGAYFLPFPNGPPHS